MCHTILQDPNFFRLLLCIDQELAGELKAGGYACGGVLHRADYPRKLAGPNVARPCPVASELMAAFRIELARRLRRSDGTASLAGRRFEIPARYRHLNHVHLRYARWDLSRVDLIDARTGAILSPVKPLDKAANADGQRRALDLPETPMTHCRLGTTLSLRICELILATALTGDQVGTKSFCCNDALMRKASSYDSTRSSDESQSEGKTLRLRAIITPSLALPHRGGGNLFWPSLVNGEGIGFSDAVRLTSVASGGELDPK